MAELLRGLFQPLFRDPLPSPAAYVKGGGVSDLSLLRKYAPTGAGAFLFNFARTDRTFQLIDGAAAADDAGEAVGLALDSAAWDGKTRAEVIAAQPQLVANPGGPFTSMTGVLDSGASAVDLVDGEIRVTRGAGTTYVYIEATTEVGAFYAWDIEARAGTASVLVRGGSTVGGLDLYDSGAVAGDADRTIYIKATTTTSYLRFQINGATVGSTVFLGKCALRKIPGNHAYQSGSTSYRGLRQSDGSILLDGADDHWLTPLLLSAAGTFAVDFNVSSTDGADGDALMGNFTTSGSKGGSCGINQLGQIFAGVGSLSTLVCKGTNNVLGQRTTLIFTYGGGQAALYENEVEVWSGSQGGTPTTEAITLGAIGVNGAPLLAYCTAGKMYNAMVLPAAITPAEAAALSRQWRNA